MDTDSILRLLQDVATEVINPRFRSLSSGEVQEKAPGDLVTVADHEAEVLITEALTAAYPEAVVLGEEAYAHDRSLLERYRVARHGFTVDPIDGTKNFVNGSKDHAVMVAELRDGAAVRGWIWQPQYELAYVAEAGAGAKVNGAPLHTTPPTGGPASWRGVTSRRSWLSRRFADLAPLELTWVCCGVDYPHLIAGDADFVLYAHAWPWDHEPGGLILREAGGYVGPLGDSSLIAAADRATYDAVLERIESQTD